MGTPKLPLMVSMAHVVFPVTAPVSVVRWIRPVKVSKAPFLV